MRKLSVLGSGGTRPDAARASGVAVFTRLRARDDPALNRVVQATLIAAVVGGVAIGLGSYTFVYARGYSYLTDDPAACANCHVMRDHFDAWTRGSHRAVATCNDCHTPPGLLPKYVTKARNGFWHSFYFTVGGYPDPLRITPRNHDIAEQACRKCHEELTASIEPVRSSPTTSHAGALSCTTCHRTVGHLE